MRFNLTTEGDKCALTENTPSNSVRWVIPVAKDVLVKGLIEILTDPEKRDQNIENGVTADRLRDGIRVSASGGSFLIPYAHIFPMIGPTQ